MTNRVKPHQRRKFGPPSTELRGVMTQQEVADQLGVSRARIGQLERRAFLKIKRYLTRGVIK